MTQFAEYLRKDKVYLMALSVGIHIGEREITGVITDETGSIISTSRNATVKKQAEKDIPADYVEINPESIWQAVLTSLEQLRASSDVNTEDIISLGISSIPNTLIAAGENGNPLHPAIMGSDTRAGKESRIANAKLETLVKKQGYQFEPASTLAKIIWLMREKHELCGKVKKFIPVTGFITGKLTGEFSVTDTSNAINMGYDIIDMKWHSSLRQFGLFPESLPSIVKPGEVIGSVLPSATGNSGLSKNTAVIAGSTSEIALPASSGAILPGQWNSHIGGNLEVRGISQKFLKDKLLRIRTHIHPEGFWIPAGTSRVGEKILREKFQGEDLSLMNERRHPSSIIVYPLNYQGEKFPFVNPSAEGFIVGKPEDKYDLYSGYLEGIGYVEKWAYEILNELGFEIGSQIFSTGSGNETWLQKRASILEKVIAKPVSGSPEMGIAILAASKTIFHSLTEAEKSMVHIEKKFEPEQSDSDIYHSKYRKFRQACRAIGYE